MPKIKYPTSFLKDRRVELGLTQADIAFAIGVTRLALQKAEQRGELPEVHFKKLALILQVSTSNLYMEKTAPMIRAMFQIPKDSFRKFIEASLGTDRALGHKPMELKK